LPGSPPLPDSPAGFLESGAGYLIQRPATEAALLRFRGEPTHESVTVPELNVVVVNKLFGRFDGGGIVRAIVREFGYNGTELPVDADDVSAIIWRGAAPFD
jgi:hypothetical protein